MLATKEQRAAPPPGDLVQLAHEIKQWGRALGFQGIGIAEARLDDDELRLRDWLRAGCHGEMDYMARHGTKRSRPRELVPGTLRVIAARMDYLPPDAAPARAVLDDPARAYISRYALGRDYHKVVRRRLQRLAERIAARIGPFGYRAFVDSAPVLEKALARAAGLGWIGKHTVLLERGAGSWFFLGELYTDLPLPEDEPASTHCGTCEACIAVCPTGAITAPYRLDARRCISYLTIELRGAIPVELRPLIGNRVFGCDDCQLVCPWNGGMAVTAERDFHPRHGLDAPLLAELIAWSEAEFAARTAGSPLRRAGYLGWLRNVAVALGNGLRRSNGAQRAALAAALGARLDHPSAMVREHVAWALDQAGPPSTSREIY